jgi:hypothetical protein
VKRNQLAVRYSTIGLFLVAIGGLLFGPLIQPAGAAPPGQNVCGENTGFRAGSLPAAPVPGAEITVQGQQQTVVFFSADVCVDQNAEVRISWAIDGVLQPEYAFGPGNLANAGVDPFCEASTLMNIIPLEGGTHTIQAFWRVSGPPATAAAVFSPCVAAIRNGK